MSSAIQNACYIFLLDYLTKISWLLLHTLKHNLPVSLDEHLMNPNVTFADVGNAENKSVTTLLQYTSIWRHLKCHPNRALNPFWHI